jgi:hypothetical protein
VLNMKKTTESLDIKNELDAVNRRDYDFLDGFPEEVAKTFSPYVFMRYIGNPQGDQDLQEWCIERTNEFVNKHHWTLSKDHKKLLWKLSAAIGTGMSVRYQYLAANKKEKTDKFEKLLADLNPAMKLSDVKMLSQLMTDEEKSELLDSLGYDKKQRKQYE